MLEEICDITIGRTPARNNPQYWGEGYPWLSISDMNPGRFLTTTKESITDLAIKECNCRVVKAGTLLLSFKLSIGKVGINTIPLYTNEAIAALPIKQPTSTDQRYLYWTLQHLDLERYVDKAAKGKTLNSAKLREIRIPLPSLDEQRAIAAVLDKADALRENRRKAINKLDTLLQAVFLDMFGDPVSNSKGLSTKPIEEFGTVTTGNTPPRTNPDFFGNKIEWIKSDNINTPFHILTRAEEGLSEVGRKVGRWVPAGSILVTCIAGSAECIGNVGIADREVAFNQQINAITPNSETNSYFLYAQLLLAKRLIQRASTNSMKGMVSKSNFSQVELLAPEKPQQDNFGLWFERFLSLRKKNVDAAGLSDNLFHSLQQRAFNGELFNDKATAAVLPQKTMTPLQPELFD